MKSILLLLVLGFLAVNFSLSQVCPSNAVLEVASGNVTSPLYPNNYPGNKNCSWLIQAPQGQHIKLVINTFDVQDCGYLCTCDYLKIGIGKTSTDRSNKYCQGELTGKTDLSKPIYSIYNNIWLQFQSNDEPSNLFKGFSATFEQINYQPPVCPSDAVIYSDNNGSVSSPNYPNNYPESTHCYWLISVSADSRIKLNFKDFAVEETGCRYDPPSKCTCDYVKVYDGKTNETLAELCGKALPNPLVSSSNKMLIEFFSSSSGNEKGFRAHYGLTDDPATKPGGSVSTTTTVPNSTEQVHTLASSTRPSKGFASTSAGSFGIITTLLAVTVWSMS